MMGGVDIIKIILNDKIIPEFISLIIRETLNYKGNVNHTFVWTRDYSPNISWALEDSDEKPPIRLFVEKMYFTPSKNSFKFTLIPLPYLRSLRKIEFFMEIKDGKINYDYVLKEIGNIIK